MNCVNTKPIHGEDLCSLVPHRGKMVLLTRVLRYDLASRRLEAEYDITRECLFFREDMDGVPSWIGFELIAQSISALSGIGRREQGLPPRMGFILSISEMTLYVPALPCGRAARIVIQEETVMNSVYSFRGHVFLDETESLTAKLTVMETEVPSAALAERGA